MSLRGFGLLASVLQPASRRFGTLDTLDQAEELFDDVSPCFAFGIASLGRVSGRGYSCDGRRLPV